MQLRVVSYNVLSSHLASPLHFTTVNPDHLKPSNRLPAVLNKLEKELESSFGKPIICLQEVSYDWAGAFHVWFSQRKYSLVFAPYGRKSNGYMGCALAWPMDSFEAVNVDISRLSDKRSGGWPPRIEKSFLTKIWEKVYSSWDAPLKLLGLKEDKKAPVDPWNYSEWRFNAIITATLCDKKSGQSFCIGNYHMPCAFFAPAVMTIHSEMAAKHVQKIAAAENKKLARSGSLPYILTGDFNIKPQDSQYQMLTKGTMHPDDPAFPLPKNGYEWTPTIAPMRSAYGSSASGEPNFTNYAQVREDDPFIDTLDYIFLSSGWQIVDVLPLPHRDNANGPFPNLDEGEPSDHVLLAANLRHS